MTDMSGTDVKEMVIYKKKRDILKNVGNQTVD